MANFTGLILGVSGVANSGKDTTADILVEEHGFVKVGLADPVKQLARKVYAFSDEQLWGPSLFRNLGDNRYQRADGSFLSPREALQLLGNEWGRKCYPNTWVDLCIHNTLELLNDGGVKLKYTQQSGLTKCRDGLRGRGRSIHGVVIPDVRFKNEVAAIKEAGGLVLRVSRPGAGLSGTPGLHLSETEQSSIPDSAFDRVLQNTGTIDELRAMIRDFVSGIAR